MNRTLSASETAFQGGPPSAGLERKSITPKWRWFSLAEFLLGAVLVIAHNVYRLIPNEVPILAGLGLISLRLREKSWRGMGLGIPASWRRTVWIALAAAVRLLVGMLVIELMIAHFWSLVTSFSGMYEIAGNLKVVLQWFLFI